jgi:solute carrier family 12 sodium/potassium/chloride transporter 2
MVLIYMGISRSNTDKKGLAKLFKGVIFQLSREMQSLLQKRGVIDKEEHWRPFVICITKDTFNRISSFDMVRWMLHILGTLNWLFCWAT